MAKGVPACGYRVYKNKDGSTYQREIKPRTNDNIVKFVAPVLQNETKEQIAERLNERFEILDILTQSCIIGDSRSLIVSGPPGLGKSYTIEKALRELNLDDDNHIIIRGYIRATGLFKMLYKYRHTGQIIVIDDSDSIFFDDISLNILKAVCDTTEQRHVSWLAETKLNDNETGEVIPKSFDFNGSIIFLTNYDFDAMIARGHKLAPHLQALVSRSQYIDLTMKSTQDYLVRIEQVINQGMLSDLSEPERKDVVNFIHENSSNLRELSLRMAIKIAAIRKTSNNWRKIATVTCCKNKVEINNEKIAAIA